MFATFRSFWPLKQLYLTLIPTPPPPLIPLSCHLLTHSRSLLSTLIGWDCFHRLVQGLGWFDRLKPRCVFQHFSSVDLWQNKKNQSKFRWFLRFSTKSNTSSKTFIHRCGCCTTTTATVVLEASSRTIVSSQTGEGPSAHCLSHEVIKPTKPNPTKPNQPQ